MNIWLIRHGESLGNVHEAAYRALTDPKVPLTEWGAQQAREAGAFIRSYYEQQLEHGIVTALPKLRVYFSPFLRTRQTKDALVAGLSHELVENSGQDSQIGWEDDRIREQSFGVFSNLTRDEDRQRLFPAEYELFNALMNAQGRYYAVAPGGGESRAQVTDRVRLFISSLYRDMQTDGVTDFAIVSHGVTMRAFEKAYMHRTVDWFEQSVNPGNAEVRLIQDKAGSPSQIASLWRGASRPAALGYTYKAEPLGGWEALEQQTGLTRYQISGQPPMKPLPGFEHLVGVGWVR